MSEFSAMGIPTVEWGEDGVPVVRVPSISLEWDDEPVQVEARRLAPLVSARVDPLLRDGETCKPLVMPFRTSVRFHGREVEVMLRVFRVDEKGRKGCWIGTGGGDSLEQATDAALRDLAVSHQRFRGRGWGEK